jgi:hypothetical protein
MGIVKEHDEKNRRRDEEDPIPFAKKEEADLVGTRSDEKMIFQKLDELKTAWKNGYISERTYDATCLATMQQAGMISTLRS